MGLQQKESSSMFCILWRVWALRQIPFCVRMMASVSCLFSICPPKIAAFETEYSSLKITAPRHGLYHLVLFSTFFLFLYLKHFFFLPFGLSDFSGFSGFSGFAGFACCAGG